VPSDDLQAHREAAAQYERALRFAASADPEFMKPLANPE